MMPYHKLLILFVFLTTIHGQAAQRNCRDIVSDKTTESAQVEAQESEVAVEEEASELERVYAGPGVVIPREIVCDYCGVGNLAPASLQDPRYTLISTTADLQALQAQNPGKAPNFLGAALRCRGCGGHTPLWELGRPGQAPRPRAVTQRLPILTDTNLGKRYVELPAKYLELADPSSEINQLARAQHIAICPSCSVVSLTNSRPAAGVSCSGCGQNVPATNIFNTSELMNAADKGTKNGVRQNANGPGETTHSRRNIQPAPERLPKERLATPEETPDIQQGRRILNQYMTRWIAAGVTAIAVAAGSAYYVNNDPMIAEGQVIQIQDHVAVVKFHETPYFISDVQLQTYEANIVLDDRNALPGEEPMDVQVSDRVTVHYSWSDFHYLPFVFHPYEGAEFPDGSIVDGNSIQ